MPFKLDPQRPLARAVTLYSCRRCGDVVDGFGVFAAGRLDDPRYYCRTHIPWWSRLKVWWRERGGDW